MHLFVTFIGFENDVNSMASHLLMIWTFASKSLIYNAYQVICLRSTCYHPKINLYGIAASMKIYKMKMHIDSAFEQYETDRFQTIEFERIKI